MMELATFVLILCLALVLTFYNQRQARALEYMARLEEDRAAREIKARRERRASELDIDAMRWLEGMLNPRLPFAVTLTGSVIRSFPEINTAELRSADGHTVLVSTETLSALRKHDRRERKASRRNASGRLERFAAQPLLGSRLRRIMSISRTMADTGNEFFDLEAEACGKALGLNWGAPTRLWFYVLQ